MKFPKLFKRKSNQEKFSIRCFEIIGYVRTFRRHFDQKSLDELVEQLDRFVDYVHRCPRILSISQQNPDSFKYLFGSRSWYRLSEISTALHALREIHRGEHHTIGNFLLLARSPHDFSADITQRHDRFVGRWKSLEGVFEKIRDLPQKTVYKPLNSTTINDLPEETIAPIREVVEYGLDVLEAMFEELPQIFYAQ